MDAASRPARAWKRPLGFIYTALLCWSSLTLAGAQAQPYQGGVETEGFRLSRQAAGGASASTPEMTDGTRSPLASQSGLTDAMFVVAPMARQSAPFRASAAVNAQNVPGQIGTSSRSLTGSVADSLRSLVGGTGMLSETGKGLLDTLTRRVGMAHSTFRLNTADRQLVANSDVAIIIDHSGSMKTRDCPGGAARMFASRLEWATEEMEMFADEILGASPHGISLITFDSQPITYQVNSPQQLRDIMLNLRSGGGTRLDLALDAALSEHEAHRNQRLVIAVVTDAEVNLRSSQQTLVEATRRFPEPNGVAVTLLQVGYGAEVMNRKTMASLNNVESVGAAYHVYSDVPFSQLQTQGFGRSIVAALRR